MPLETFVPYMSLKKNRRIKVLHIIQGFGTGGAETWLLQVAKYVQLYPEDNFQIDFLATGGEKAVFDEQILQTGSSIHYLKYSLSNFLSFRKALIALLVKEKYDVIHDHQDFISGWHFLAGIGHLPAKRIAHLHNPYNYVNNYITSAFRWFSFRVGRILMYLLSTHITGTSNNVMDEYGYDRWPYRSKRISPLYCGFDIERFLYNNEAKSRFIIEQGWKENYKIALFIGRIDSEKNEPAKNQKNPLFALQVACELVKRPGWYFAFAGLKGEVGLQMEAAVKLEGLSDKIHFLGVRKDVPELLSAADALLFPSLWEGLGMIAVEAQACGLTVIASDTLPTEAIVNADLVHLISLSDPVEKWIDCIEEQSSLSADRTLLNERVKKSAFHIKNSVHNMQNVYL